MLEETSKEFYMNNRENTQKRKNTGKKDKEDPKQNKSSLFQEIEKNMEQDEETKERIRDWADRHIPKTIYQKDIIKYITRLHRKQKEIRIQDIIDKFSIPEEVFSEEMKNEAKKIGIHFINGIHKEKISEDKQESAEQQQESKIKCANTPELCFEDKIIQEIKSHPINTAEKWIDVLRKAGYIIDNEKNFIKQFNKLYKTDKQKQSFHQDMSEHIFTIETKINAANGQTYRSIDLEENNRILFIEKGMIDGIYNHNDYMRRLNNLGKGK